MRKKDAGVALMIVGALWFVGVIWLIGGYDEGGLGETLLMSLGVVIFMGGVGMLMPDRADSGE